jgi:large subunit ribosomal protein L19
MASTKTKYRRTSKGVRVPAQGLAAKVQAVENAQKTNHPEFSPGDTVRVHVRIKEGEKERVQAYEGVCIGKKGGGANKSFNVRKISHGVGVERIFMENTPKIAKIEVVQEGKVRRAKLYYLRGLEGRAAKIERDIESGAAVAASAASSTTKTDKAASSKPKTK